jgi:Putative Actinobacterial Holin-X, holin superfamily III
METSAPHSQSDKSLSELTKQLSDQATALAGKEVELAKAELALKGRRLGLGAGMFGAAGLIGVYAFGALTACAILALATALDGWLAAFVVAALYGAAAGGLALIGKNQVEHGTPPVPEQAIESTKADIESTKDHVKAARND